ncbi:fungal-specific transcription factor domain-containing protein [Xylaria intraflava]|nr:fungal-specific transcription factor domain-containing protein [Xylaria intraflava]
MRDQTTVSGVPMTCTRLKRKDQLPHRALRLSWPKANDRRRAVVGASPPENHAAGRKDRPTSETQFVHISLSDVEMHHHMTVRRSADITTPPALTVPLPWNPQKLKVGDKDLLDYFKHVAARALPTFGQDPTDLRNALLRMSLSSDTHSATAVLRSLLAFSSLHRHGMQSQALELKVAALEALGASESTNLDTAKLVHHIAALMLLYSFEVQQSSFTSGDWVLYLCGIEKLIRSSHLDSSQGDEDLVSLLDWVYYNDVLGRFSLRHWDDNGKGVRMLPPPPTIRSEASRASPSAAAILGFFSEAYNLAAHEDMELHETTASKEEYIKILDWRIRTISTTNALDEAFQLAALVYLDRITGSYAHPPRTQQYIDDAFLLFSKLEYCERQFPLFIVGCEAQSDEQRTILLDLISRSEGNAASRSYCHLKLLLEAIWAQDDLADKQSGNIEYRHKLISTMSRCSFAPCLV